MFEDLKFKGNVNVSAIKVENMFKSLNLCHWAFVYSQDFVRYVLIKPLFQGRGILKHDDLAINVLGVLSTTRN